MGQDQVVTSETQEAPAPSSRARAYLLLMLATISMTSWSDRAVFNLLVEPIKHDLRLSDTEVGLIGGLAFAILYAALGVPIARLAERKSRLAISVAALTVWSLMAMLCAACTNFWQLALARAGGGIGESACLPCAQSMLSDSYPPERRASAISVYSLGIPVGTIMGLLVGAWVAEAYSWRVAFVVVGAPGLLLAVLAAFTLKEPVRGRFDPPVSETPPSLLSVFRTLWGRRSFLHLQAGVAIAVMLSAGIGGFMTPLLMRSSFGLGLTHLAYINIFLIGTGFIAGVLAGGLIGDKLAERDARWTLWFPALAFVIAAPAWAGAFFADSIPLFLVLALIGQTATAIYVAPTFGTLNNMVEPRMRATAVAIMGVVNSLIGLGLGPVLVGVLSDFAAQSLYGVDSAQCAAQVTPTCAKGGFLGLQASLAVTALLFLWSAFHYWRAAAAQRREQDVAGL